MRRVLFLCLVTLACLSVQAQALTLEGLRYRVALKLDEDTTTGSSRQWSNVELNTWINDGIQFVSGIALCYMRDTTYELQVSKTSYAMPADYISTQSVKIGSKGASVELDRSPRGLKEAAGSDLGKGASVRILPTQWEEGGERTRTITVTPAPAITDSMTVTYFAYGQTLSLDTATCGLPLSFQFCVVDYAAAEAWSNTRTQNTYWDQFILRLQLLVPTIQQVTDPETPTAVPGQ